MHEQPFVPYTKQSINSEDIEKVSQALQQPIITRGAKVEEFEEAIANYCGATYAVAFNSATSALFAACDAVQCNAHDQLVVTPNTFVATVTAGTRCGASPLFVDIDRNTGNMDLAELTAVLATPKTRGRRIVFPVHFSGIPIDMMQLDRAIRSPNVVIIEDAAHAFGSCYSDGKRVGCCAYSQMTIFSFHPSKTITTGEGGVVTTNDPELYHRLRLFRNVGVERDPNYLQDKSPWYYEVQELSGNYHLTDFQAALGLSQLQRLDAFIAKRQKLVALYRQQLAGIEGVRMFEGYQEGNVCHHLFVVQIDYPRYKTTRAKVMEALKSKGIGSQVHYIPVYSHPVFKKLCGDMGDYFPETEAYYAQALSLPLYYDMSEDDVARVCQVLLGVLSS